MAVSTISPQSALPDRTAAHVAAIQECATMYMQGELGRTVTGVGLAWDFAALTCVVEQIVEEARADVLLRVGEWQRHPLPVDRGPLAAPPADTTDAASAALVVEAEREHHADHIGGYAEDDCPYLACRLAAHVTRLDAETARLREERDAARAEFVRGEPHGTTCVMCAVETWPRDLDLCPTHQAQEDGLLDKVRVLRDVAKGG